MSLTSDEYRELAAALGRALQAGGLTVERGRMERGRLVYEQVDPENILGRFMQIGYRVSFADAPPAPDGAATPPAPPLSIVRGSEDDGA